MSKRQLSREAFLWITCGSGLLVAPALCAFVGPQDWSYLLNLSATDYTAIALLAAFLYFGELAYSTTIARIGAPLLSLLIPLRLVVAFVASGMLYGEWNNTWVEVLALGFAVLVGLWYYGLQWARRRQVLRQALRPTTPGSILL